MAILVFRRLSTSLHAAIQSSTSRRLGRTKPVENRGRERREDYVGFGKTQIEAEAERTFTPEERELAPHTFSSNGLLFRNTQHSRDSEWLKSDEMSKGLSNDTRPVSCHWFAALRQSSWQIGQPGLHVNRHKLLIIGNGNNVARGYPSCRHKESLVARNLQTVHGVNIQWCFWNVPGGYIGFIDLGARIRAVAVTMPGFRYQYRWRSSSSSSVEKSF
ncbi:hypothetical protein MMC26_005152 [Xylographa opegraphella]|nr:hypothetical protein [Xylographa opegraphella]